MQWRTQDVQDAAPVVCGGAPAPCFAHWKSTLEGMLASFVHHMGIQEGPLYSLFGSINDLYIPTVLELVQQMMASAGMNPLGAI